MSQPDNKSKRAVIVFNKKGEYVAVIASITQAALIQGVNKKSHLLQLYRKIYYGWQLLFSLLSF